MYIKLEFLVECKKKEKQSGGGGRWRVYPNHYERGSL